MSKHTKQEMQEMEFEEVNNANYDTVKWEPQPGEFLIGEYVEKKEECGMDNYTFFIIDDGEDKYSLLSNTVLNSLFESTQAMGIIPESDHNTHIIAESIILSIVFKIRRKIKERNTLKNELL